MPEVSDPTPLLAILQECIATSHYKGGSFTKLVQFLRQNDYKSMHIHLLKEDSCFLMLMALGRWIVEIFTGTRLEDLPGHTVTLSEFYRFIAKTFRARVHSERMSTAYAYFLNNMALVSLRFKQYTKALQYFEEIIEIYNAQKIQECVFSVAHANLAVLYKQLKDDDQSEVYIRQATQITSDILVTYIEDNYPPHAIQEVGSLLATQYSLMTQIVRQNDPKYKEPYVRIIELLEKSYIKLSHRKYWSRRNIATFLERNEPIRAEFQTLFSINLEELRFYSDISRANTSDTHVKPTAALVLPPINSLLVSPSNFKVIS
jgi:tetratricopeptide (TPR) repeat protein